MDRTYYIYYLCNSKGEPFYVGKTYNPKMREYQHKHMFKNRFVKLVILQEFNDEHKSLCSERYWISKFDSMCYNLVNKHSNSFISKDKFGIWSESLKK